MANNDTTTTNRNELEQQQQQQLAKTADNSLLQFAIFFVNISSEKFDWWGMLNRVLKFEFDWLKFRDNYFISKENFCLIIVYV